MKISKRIIRINKFQSLVSDLFFHFCLFTFAFLLLTSCEKGTEPEELTPGRRDYTWTVDTLKAFNTYLMKMWGSSANDVWAIGHGSDLNNTIWHYDGNDWTTDGISRGLNPWCIYGFAQNDVWIGGADGKIWHYDGSRWSEKLSYNEQINFQYYDIIFMDIWGETPDDVYAVGLTMTSDNYQAAIMMHYDGSKWSRVDIELEGSLKIIRKGNKTSNKYYIWNKNLNTTPDSSKYFEFDGYT